MVHVPWDEPQSVCKRPEAAPLMQRLFPAGVKTAAPYPDGSGQSAHDPYWATVTEVRELHTAASERSCVHVEIDISNNR